MKKLSFLSIVLSLGYVASAQRMASRGGDTTRPGTVVVTSAFKPTLRNQAKVNFNAGSPLPDTTRPTLRYTVPAQNLFFAYQPVPLKPLALYVDTALYWKNANYIKAGYGNYTTPYLQAGFSFGDGKKSVINVHALHTSSKGSLPFQQFSKTNAEVVGVFTDPQNEWSGKAYLDNRTQYLYGYRPDTLKFTKEQLLKRYTDIGVNAGVRNKTVNSFGLSYQPTIRMNVFNDNLNGRESDFVLDAPVTKTIGTLFAFNLRLKADFTKYITDSVHISNNLFSLSPSLQFNTPNFKVNAGFSPNWDNKIFKLLPDFTAEAKLNDEKFVLQAGWVGNYVKNNYRSLSEFNPFVAQPKQLLNTRVTEQYAGFKGSAGPHFTYNARVSYLHYSNHPLFVNDSLTGRNFLVVYEPDMQAIRLHGEIGYTVQEKFSFAGSATFTQYSSQQVYNKAYGLLPLELTGSLRWQVLKDLSVKSDLFFWDGPQYRNKQLQSQKQQAAVDLNAGIEFTILPKFSFWVNFNNILNDRYQRWNQYEVLGFNVVGGVVYSF